MSLTAYLRKRLLDLLEERRVVVWFDKNRDFEAFAEQFQGPGLTKVLVTNSRLEARRQAEEAFIQQNDGAQPAERSKNLLVYLPWDRQADERGRVVDPFEGFAAAGCAFGDKESARLQSLARQALPDHNMEIDQLFQRGRPTLEMLDVLAGSAPGPRYPLLGHALGTEIACEVAARLLAHPETGRKITAVQGAREELEQLLLREFGFSSPGVAVLGEWTSSFARYTLFSEFVFDLKCELPSALAIVPRAPESHRQKVFDLCDRLRSSVDTREAYMELAGNVEGVFHLAEAISNAGFLGARDTFPFEDRIWMAWAADQARAGELAAARTIVEQRRSSVWRARAATALNWKLLERCLEFLEVAAKWQQKIPAERTSLAEWIVAYTSADGFSELDQRQRRFEQIASECGDNLPSDELIDLCRVRYQELAGALQERFLKAVMREGWPPESTLRQTQVFDRFVAPGLGEGRRIVFFMVDAMRFEMGQDLAISLESLGSVTLYAAAGVLPAITDYGMAALLPGADGAFSLQEAKGEIVPVIGKRPIPNVPARMDLIRALYGDRFRELVLEDLLPLSAPRLKSKVGSADLLVVRTNYLDALGEGPSLYNARKYMSQVLGELRDACGRLANLGFDRAVLAADHGHVLLAEIAAGDVVQPPPGDWRLSKRRCRLGKATAGSAGVVLFDCEKIGIVGVEGELAVPTGFRVFKHGEEYFHEGISLQECVIPVLCVELAGPQRGGVPGGKVELSYRSDRFSSYVISLKAIFRTLIEESLTVRIQAFSGAGAKDTMVGEAADCDARDPASGLVCLSRNRETQVPLRIQESFHGEAIEVRATDPASGIVYARLKLKNAVME